MLDQKKPNYNFDKFNNYLFIYDQSKKKKLAVAYKS